MNRSKGRGFNRRQFFAQSAKSVAAGAVIPGLFGGMLARPAVAARGRGMIEGYGPLRPAGNELALPPGFQYSVVSYEGTRMDDGFPVPKAMDGMAAFPLANGKILLIRNHEDGPSKPLAASPGWEHFNDAGILNGMLETHYGPRAFAYDRYAVGGTTWIEVDPRTRRRVKEHWSLLGTVRNCAGGVTPWGSWLSCEETFEAAAATGAEQNHGYVFEVPVNTSPGNPAPPIPLKRLGRMAHEAAAVDPEKPASCTRRKIKATFPAFTDSCRTPNRPSLEISPTRRDGWRC